MVRDPNNEKNLLGIYDCGDGLHPSPEGYKKMVEAIDKLELFTLNFNNEPKLSGNEIMNNDKFTLNNDEIDAKHGKKNLRS